MCDNGYVVNEVKLETDYKKEISFSGIVAIHIKCGKLEALAFESVQDLEDLMLAAE